jgi:choline kinase
MINALILAPEITKGMKSFGSKSLLEIKKKISVLEYQINSLKDIDKNITITAAIGFESEKIIPILNKNNIKYTYNPEYKNTNQSYSLKLFLENNPNINNLFIINNGILFKKKTITANMLSGSSKIFILNKIKENFSLGCSQQEKIEYIFYDLPELWSECVYFNCDAIDAIKHETENNHINQMYLFELINKVIGSSEHSFDKQQIDKKNIMKINTYKDINKAKLFI